jgi:hypothetical protein
MKDQMKDQFKKTKKIIIKKTPGGPKLPPARGPLGQVFLALVIFLILVTAYSFLSSFSKTAEEVSLSQIATEINAGNISEIKVNGDSLKVTYKNGDEKTAKKEANTALTTTLKNYDVPTEKLSLVNIEVGLHHLLRLSSRSFSSSSSCGSFLARLRVRACRRLPSASPRLA